MHLPILLVSTQQQQHKIVVKSMEGSVVKGGVLTILIFVGAYVMGSLERADGAGPCSPSTPDLEAWKLVPCASAASDKDADVPPDCCSAVKKIIEKSNSCMCAVMLSKTAKNAHINASIAITIPQRCNISNRPIGSKCGGYTVP